MDLGLPGKFRIRQLPRIPAVCRERIAVGTYFNDMERIFSPKPGINLEHTASVASGVLSRGAGPVPPVVTTKQQPTVSTCMAHEHQCDVGKLDMYLVNSI